jgi:hypothetical protein
MTTLREGFSRRVDSLELPTKGAGATTTIVKGKNEQR